MNIDVKIFNNTLANQIQSTLNGLYTILKWGFSLGYRDVQYTQINKCV